MVIFYFVICSLLKNVYSQDSSDDKRPKEMNLKDHDFAILSLIKAPQFGKGEELIHLVDTYNRRLEKLTKDIETDFENNEKVVRVLIRLRGPAFFNTKYDEDVVARCYDYSLAQKVELNDKIEKTKLLFKKLKYAFECKENRMYGIGYAPKSNVKSAKKSKH